MTLDGPYGRICVPNKTEDIDLKVLKICVNVNVKVQQNIVYAKKIMFQILVHVLLKQINILKSIADDLVITCDWIIDVLVTVSINLNDKEATCKMDSDYVILTFLLVTILLLITVIICYCFIKYLSK